jgi:hypothetical protein
MKTLFTCIVGVFFFATMCLSKDPELLKPVPIETVRFVKEKKTPASVFVIEKPKELTDDSLRDEYMAARHRYAKDRRVPRKPLTIVGSLLGDKPVDSTCYFTLNLKPRDFFVSGKSIFLLGSCEFRFSGHDKPSEYWLFTAELPDLAPGKYTLFVRVTPQGKEYEEYKNSRGLGFPDYSLLKCEFEVEGKD